MLLTRKESLRASYARKLKAEGRWTSFSTKQKAGHVRVATTPRKPLKKVSRSQRGRMERYFPIRTAWLDRPENAVCAICLCLGLEPARATEVHHARGRNGPLLFDTRFFIPSCRAHREWPHLHPREARTLGLLAGPVEWGVSVPR